MAFLGLLLSNHTKTHRLSKYFIQNYETYLSLIMHVADRFDGISCRFQYEYLFSQEMAVVLRLITFNIQCDKNQ